MNNNHNIYEKILKKKEVPDLFYYTSIKRTIPNNDIFYEMSLKRLPLL